MAEIVNLTAKRALASDNNRNLSLDDLVQIVKDDPDAEGATGYIIIPVKRDENGHFAVGASYRSNMHVTELVYALTKTLRAASE